MIKKVKKKNIGKVLDKLWAECIKLKAGGRCEACGEVRYLNSHHIYSRSKYPTRWDTDNGVCLCAGHHTLKSDFSAHKTPVEFTEWLVKTRGQEFIDKLRVKAKLVRKFNSSDMESIKLSLESQIEILKMGE